MVITEHGMNLQWQGSEGQPLLQPRSAVPAAETWPRTYMASAILGLCTGPWPLGVVAIYQARRSKNALNQSRAETFSGKARNWARATLICAIALWWMALLAIMNNIKTGMYTRNDSFVFPIVLFAVLLAVADIGLVLTARRLLMATIVVCALMLVIAGSCWAMLLT